MLRVTNLSGFGVRSKTAPEVKARLASNNGSGTGNPAITVSGMSPAAGDLLVVGVYNRDNRTYTWPAGWSELFDSNGLSVGYRTSDGAETTVTPTLSGISRTAWVAFRISGWSGTPENGTIATGTGNPDPPSLSPSWGAGTPTLFIALGASRATSDITAGPGGDYTQFQTSRANNDPSLASAEFRGGAASSNPGAFTVSGTSDAAAQTIAIKGA